jgi:hypothetical protein
MIQQSANPNATNSELDAKKIINNVQLNNDQLSELKRDFAELVVDNMDTKSLVQFVYENLLLDYKQYNQHEMREAVDNYDDELFDELVDNVTNETVLDINNTGGKF